MPDVFADTLAHCSASTAAFAVEAVWGARFRLPRKRSSRAARGLIANGGGSGGEDERD